MDYIFSRLTLGRATSAVMLSMSPTMANSNVIVGDDATNAVSSAGNSIDDYLILDNKNARNFVVAARESRA